MNGHQDIGSAADRSFFATETDAITPEDVLSVEEVTEHTEGYTADPGPVIDAELVDESENQIAASRRSESRPPRPTKTSPPNANEWLDFFSRIVLRTLSRWYVDLLFRGIDEDELSEREVERLILSEEEREQIAQPWAEYATKNKFMRRHGRSVVAAAGSIESFIVLGAYVRRVNKIAARHRKPVAKVVRTGNVSSGQNGQAGTNENPPGGQFPDGGIHIINPGTS